MKKYLEFINELFSDDFQYDYEFVEEFDDVLDETFNMNVRVYRFDSIEYTYYVRIFYYKDYKHVSMDFMEENSYIKNKKKYDVEIFSNLKTPGYIRIFSTVFSILGNYLKNTNNETKTFGFTSQDTKRLRIYKQTINKKFPNFVISDEYEENGIFYVYYKIN